jgi:hypothetical protein
MDFQRFKHAPTESMLPLATLAAGKSSVFFWNQERNCVKDGRRQDFSLCALSSRFLPGQGGTIFLPIAISLWWFDDWGMRF